MDKSRNAARSGSNWADGGLTRRHLLTTPAVGTLAASTPVGARTTVLCNAVSATDFGAKGDGRTDDTNAIQSALAAAQVVDLPHGSFRIVKPLVLRDGQVLRGAGRSGWEPYTGEGPPASTVRTEIVVENGVAIDARGTNNAAVAGLAIRARLARQSKWGGEPGFQAGTTGIDINGSQHFDARQISFHGLEAGVSSVANSDPPTQMPHIGDWVAQDCATVFRFISTDRDFYAVRDARIDGCIAALHCGRIAEIRKCDGLRLEDVRFFQCKTNSLLIEHSPFVSITGATLFETGSEALVLRNCQYVTMSGMQVARTGYYTAGKLLQKSAVLLEDCADVAFDGLIEQPIGRAFTVRGCVNLSINAAIGTPFWSTGSLWSSEGAIHIERSTSTLINASFGGTTYWVAVWADAASTTSISGRITTEGPAGVVRCTQLQSPPMGQVVRTNTATPVAPGATVQLDTLRVLVPPRKTLLTCSVELAMPDIAFAAGTQRWKPTPATEPGGGSLSIERNPLHRNDTAQARYALVPIGVYNPTSRSVTIPAGHEVRLSLVLE